MMAPFWGDRGHCPRCGRFCRDIIGLVSDLGLEKVEGKCKKHGKVDLTNQEWSYDDFDDSEQSTPLAKKKGGSP